MLDSLKSAWKLDDLRGKILFTLAMFLVFRIGAHVPVPGINTDALRELLMGEGATLFGMMDMLSGGSFSSFAVFAMGIMPYINASIIMQLLTVVIPRLEQLAKEGEEGRKVITQYTRYGTAGLGFIQALGMSYALNNFGIIIDPSFTSFLTIAITLTAGTVFLMWIGELITEKGIGNGISLIIFAGIVASVPGALTNMVQMMQAGTIGVFTLVLLALIGLLVIAGVVSIHEGQRRIPVQYAKRVVGRKVYGGQTTHVPLKVNQAGVIPVIFAMSILLLPQTIVTWFDNRFANFLERMLDFTSIPYMIIYATLIIFFTYFYTAVTFNPADVADNMKKNGGFIPGLRPGKPTAEYIDRVLTRITLAGALFLAGIAVMPNVFMAITDLNIYFGGTALIIVVGVALETMKQIESHLMMRHYQGFMK
ncbi:preprotein translocase subunit SecY [Desulfitispora alkaliphila]|uniref:preprotein translocase subunit SecY n=1 Tax=Desulfitispora alkaliphila TaxID=622674 RepID=UPI003D250752